MLIVAPLSGEDARGPFVAAFSIERHVNAMCVKAMQREAANPSCILLKAQVSMSVLKYVYIVSKETLWLMAH